MRRALAALLVSAAGVAGCGVQGQVDAPVVLAASSLQAILPELSPGASFSFDGSSGLVDQLSSGARADVFASADRRTMDRAIAEGLIDGVPRAFATNHLVVVVPSDNPASVTGFDESLNRGKLVVCAVEVPCGAATERMAAAAGLELDPVSEEMKVVDVLGKVVSGEADAGIVYATDAAASDTVSAITIPRAATQATTYWVAVVRDAPHPEAAHDFVDALTGRWQDELRAAGFGPPR